MRPRAVFPTVLQPDTMQPRAVFPTVSQPDTPADSKPAVHNILPETQKVQVSIFNTKDVALNLPEGYNITGGTKPRQSPDTRKHPEPAARGDDNGGHRQHGQVLTHQGRKLVESIRARETSAYMSLLVANCLFTALMIGLIPATDNSMDLPVKISANKVEQSSLGDTVQPAVGTDVMESVVMIKDASTTLTTHTGSDSSTDMYTASESQESPGSRIQTMPAVPKDQMFLATSTSCNISRVPPCRGQVHRLGQLHSRE